MTERSDWQQLFDVLDRVYSDLAQLLADAEGMLRKHGFVLANQSDTSVAMEQSRRIDRPSWWYPGWIARFHLHRESGRVVFVTVLLHNRREDDIHVELREPIVVAGHMLRAGEWRHWMAKSWAWTNTPADGSFVVWTASEPFGSVVESFAWPLSAIQSDEALARLIITPLVERRENSSAQVGDPSGSP
jgi:hypothetical protein